MQRLTVTHPGKRMLQPPSSQLPPPLLVSGVTDDDGSRRSLNTRRQISSRKSSRIITGCCVVLVAVSFPPSSMIVEVNAWNTNYYRSSSDIYQPSSGMWSKLDSKGRNTIATLPLDTLVLTAQQLPRLSQYKQSQQLQLVLQSPHSHHHLQPQASTSTMLLDQQRLLSIPSVGSLPLSYRRTEGFVGGGPSRRKTLTSSITTRDQQQQQQQYAQERRGVLGFDIFALESTTQSSASSPSSPFPSDRDSTTGMTSLPSSTRRTASRRTTRGGGGASAAPLGITWQNVADWTTNLPNSRAENEVDEEGEEYAEYDDDEDEEDYDEDEEEDFDRRSTLATKRTSRSLPTRSQIDQLKVTELKRACLERGLSRSGNKAILQDRLWKWSLDQRKSATTPAVKITSGDFLTRYFESSDAATATTKNRLQEESTSSLCSKGQRDAIVDSISRIFDDSTYTPNSLAEWARNIDLEPLLQKRKEIHRQKREGRPTAATRQSRSSTKVLSPSSSSIPRKTHSTTRVSDFSTAEYLKSLARALRAPSSPYASNIQVKELYSASKQADQLGERKVAMDLLQTLLMVTPNDAKVYRRLARMHAENDDVPKARQTLQKGLEYQPENPWLWHGLGHLEQTHGSTELAKEYFQKAIAFDAAFAQSYHALGTLEHGLGNVANAMRILKKGLEFCPTNHRLWHASGDVYREAQMLDDAARSYRRALDNGPPTSHCFAQSSLAAVAYEQGRLAAARRWLFKAIEGNNGRHSQGWIALAQLEESVGNIAEARLICTSAIAQYERGLLETRERYLALSGQKKKQHQPPIRSSVDEDDDKTPIPVELTTQLLKQVPPYRSGDKFVHVYRNWARLEEEYGDMASVDRVYERARAAFPNDSKLLVSWAQYHDRNLNFEKARELYQDACAKTGQRHASPYRMLGQFEMSQSNFQEARRIMFLGTRAISQTDFMEAPDRKGLPELLLTWAVCEWHLDHMDRAEDLFGHALRLVSPTDSEFKSLILYCLARFQYHRNELLLAQHCVGLALKESPSLSGGGQQQLWELWARIARDMDNLKLEKECLDQASLVRQRRSTDRSTTAITPGSGEERRGVVANVEPLMRRDPWHVKLFGSEATSSHQSRFNTNGKSHYHYSFIQALKFPVKKDHLPKQSTSRRPRPKQQQEGVEESPSASSARSGFHSHSLFP